MEESFEGAVLSAYLSLVTALHEKKILHIDEVIAQFGNTLDFARIQHMEGPENQNYKLAIYKALSDISAAYVRKESGKPPD